MIKRRFYKQEHADKNDASDSSSSSESEIEAEAIDESEDDAISESKEENGSCSTSSGYNSEDGPENEVDVDSSELPIDEDDSEDENDRSVFADTQLSSKRSAKKPETFSNTIAGRDLITSDVQSCNIKCKSVSKCRICPGVVCLTEETLRAHLNSKRHIRSEKLLDEGRLKSILNDEGEIENQETPAELHARLVALAQDNHKKKNKGRQRQRKRSRKTSGNGLDVGKAKEWTNTQAKVDELKVVKAKGDELKVLKAKGDYLDVRKARKPTKTRAKIDELKVVKAKESTKPPAKKRRKDKN